MRIEAHLNDEKGKIEVRIFGEGTSKDRFDSVRRAVSASRYAGQLYNPNGVRYWYPLSVDTCLEMREVWGDNLRVHKNLSAWYREALEIRKSQVSLTEATDASLPRLSAAYPEFNAWLKGDQRVTAQWIANAYRGGGLLADEVGTGKTAGVVAGLIERGLYGPQLVVCPKISVESVWKKEFSTHVPDIPVYACTGGRAKRERELAAFIKDPAEGKVLIIVSEMLRIRAIRAQGRIQEFLGYEYPDLYDIEWASVVVDESQNVLGSSDVVKGNLAGEGAKGLTFAQDRLKLAVSATPFGKGGKIEAIFGTLHWLWPDEFPSRWKWLERYFEVTKDKVYLRGGGGATQQVNRVGGLKNEKEFWASLGPRVLRRRMEDVSEEHRGLRNYVEVKCAMAPAQRKQYSQFAQDAELAVDGGIISTVGVLDFMTRCRQFANGVLRKEGGRVVYTRESCKIEQLMAHLSKLEPGRKVVIGSQYNEFLDVVEERLNKAGYWSEWVGNAATHKAGALVRIDGKTADGRRQAYMHAFQTDPRITVCLLNAQAGGVSITLDAGEEIHALDEMYPPEKNTQFYGRIFRRGRAHEVFYYLYRSIGTIDEVIGYNVGQGHEKQLRLLDGRRGKEYVRKLAQYRDK